MMIPGINICLCLLILVSIVTGSYSSRLERDNDRGFLRVTSLLEPPFLQLVKTNDSESLRGNARYEGFISDLLEEIGRRADMSYAIFLVKDGRYGMKDKDGQWSGMIGELIRREAEIAAAPLTRNREREAVVDFTYAFMSAPLTMLVPKDSPYERLEDLVNSSYPDISYGVVEGGNIASSFSASTQPPYSLVWANMASKNGMLVDYVEEGVSRVQEGNYVLIAEEPFMQFKAGMEPCQLRTTEPFYIAGEPRSYALAMPSGHPYLTEINDALLQMQQEKVLAKLYKKWWSPQECASGAPTLTHSAALVFLTPIAILFFLRKIY